MSNTRVRTVHVMEETGPAIKLLDALAEMPGVVVTLDEIGMCGVCGQSTSTSQMIRHPHVNDRICRLCNTAATEIEGMMHEAHKRAWCEFSTQLPQMIRDRRNGAEDPTLYRGFE